MRFASPMRIAVATLMAALAAGCRDSATTAPASPDAGPAPLLAKGGKKSCTTTTSITSSFDKTALAPGSYVWYSAVVNVDGRDHHEETTVYFGNSWMTVDGFTPAVPTGIITFSASATTASTVWDPMAWSWRTTVPANYDGNIFLTGYGVQIGGDGVSGNLKSINWSGTFWSADMDGLRFTWRWAAAAYTQFGTNGDVQVKPIDGRRWTAFANNDDAGTPENYKDYFTRGARGNGNSDYTGTSTPPATVNCR